MDFSRFEGLEGNRFIERAVVDEVMYELMRLSGQEYVDLYAADIKEGKTNPPTAARRLQPDSSAGYGGAAPRDRRGVVARRDRQRDTVPATTITASAHHT